MTALVPYQRHASNTIMLLFFDPPAPGPRPAHFCFTVTSYARTASGIPCFPCLDDSTSENLRHAVCSRALVSSTLDRSTTTDRPDTPCKRHNGLCGLDCMTPRPDRRARQESQRDTREQRRYFKRSCRYPRRKFCRITTTSGRAFCFVLSYP